MSETCGRQEATAYNGHFGDLESCLLREGNVHSAKDWKTVLEPIAAGYRGRDLRRYFRGDAAFADPAICEYLEAECDGYAIRLPANDILNREIGTLMTRPVGRPPRAPVVLYHEFHYKAAAWDIQRRVIAKVEWPRLSFHARSIIFQIGELAVSRKLFAAILRWETSVKHIWNF